MHAAARRTLPEGHDDDASRYFIPRNLRSHYVTVSIPPTSDLDTEYTRALDAACDWAMRDHEGKHGIPGGDLT